MQYRNFIILLASIILPTVSHAATTKSLDRIDQRDLPLDNVYLSPNEGEGVHIYIFDTGYDDNYLNNFQGRVGNGYNAMNPGSPPKSGDGEWHGSRVAAAAAGSQIGVAQKATIHHIRINNYIGHATEENFIRGANWLLSNVQKPAVANFSSWAKDFQNPKIEAKVKQLLSAGITITVAAGNYGSNICTDNSPSRLPMLVPGVILVGGTIPDNDKVWPNSNYGNCVDVLAPVTDDLTPHKGSGTSFAAPRVAGVAALYLSDNPSASPSEVKQAIIEASTKNELTGLRGGTPNRLLHNLVDFESSADRYAINHIRHNTPRTGYNTVPLFTNQNNAIWYSHDFDRYANSRAFSWNADDSLKTRVQYKVEFGKGGVTQKYTNIPWSNYKQFPKGINSGWLPVLPGKLYNMHYGTGLAAPGHAYRQDSTAYVKVYYRLRSEKTGFASNWRYLRPIWFYYGDD